MFNISIKQVRIFVEVAKAQSFADAARVMHLSQPALSLAIQNLEASIGGRLFVRSTRKLALTPEGKLFFPLALRLLADWDSALIDVNNLFTMQRGKLNMAVMPSFSDNLLPAIIRDYHQAFPNININIADIVMEDAIASVIKEQNELAITFEAELSDNIVFEPLFTDSFIMVFPSVQHGQFDWAKAIDVAEIEQDWRSIFRYPMVAMNRDSTVRNRLDRLLYEHDIQPNIVAEANQLDTLGRLAAAGLGITIVPAICQQQMENFGLQTLTLPEAVLSRRIGVITKARKSLSVAAQHMVDLLRQQFC